MINGTTSGGSRRPQGTSRSKTSSEEPAFRTPEEVAKTDLNKTTGVSPEKAKPGFATNRAGQKRRSPKEWFLALTKRQKIAVIAAAIVLLAGAGVAFEILRSAPAPAPVTKSEEPKEPVKTIIYSPLTGVPVSKKQSELPVTGVMIENSPDARPQSGLHKAGVVFEAIAEGGITRFLTLYQEEQPDYVGPVRSVRPYYVDWLQGFDAAIAHAGGSGEALHKIRVEKVKDLDQFANGGAFRRVSNRYAPHNLYTSLADLTKLQRSKGWNGSKFTGFTRKAEAASSTPTARTVNIKISSALYDVSYNYHAASNSYKRVMAGRPHTDERSKQQISPKVVIALVVPYGIHADGIHSTYKTIGTGKAYIFQDGIVTQATWRKASGKSQITFKTTKGKVVALNAGQTWITATGLATNVSYKP